MEQESIKWPQPQGTQLTTVIQEFEHGITGLENNLPNIIGAMDGSVHDARVFYRSSLYYEISHNPEQWVPGESYIIADPAYCLKTYLMKPFQDHEVLTNHERRFNKVLSSMRMSVERAFGLLKGRCNRNNEDSENEETFIVNIGRERIAGMQK
ncbi:putative nuclease HARBI1 [Gigaspora margarita]|uniref:Putative nuclease HARBI1 n=1 Tax=Gigaspora margarita TaxID=4874 RepID=A0A8H4AUL1_GIGMA|nr:putative nuclease HARBI1 [Gigaspora margarita]